MAHRTVEEIIKAAIPILLTALLGGVGYTAFMITKVPSIEKDLAEHVEDHKQERAQTQQQMIAIRTSIFKLREGREFDANDLKDLLSDVRTFSNSVPQLIEEIVIEEGKQPISTNPLPAVAALFPGSLPTYPSASYPLSNPDHIARFTEAALVSATRIEWHTDLDSGKVYMAYPNGLAIIKPKPGIAIEDANALSARLNMLREMVLGVTEKVAGENSDKGARWSRGSP